MSGFLTTYGANAILAGTAMPTTLYVQLHNDDPGVDGDANVATEDTREAITIDTPAAGAAANDAAAEWSSAAATEDITHVTLWDAATDGNPWWVIPRTGGTLNVTLGDVILADTGDIVLSFTLWGS